MTRINAALLALLVFMMVGCSGDDDNEATTGAQDSGASGADGGVVSGERRVPAEWETHAATWMQWPGPWEAQMRPAFADIINVVQSYEPLHLLTSTAAERDKAQRFLAQRGVPEGNITWHIVPVDNSWPRDNGPIYLTDDDSKVWLQDWRFDAWGGNFGAEVGHAQDDAVPAYIADHLNMTLEAHPDYVLERGNLEFNGAGGLVVGWDCQDDRNPGKTRAEHEAILIEAFNLVQIIWAYGHDPGDGTTGHIDGVARYIDEDTIAIAETHWGAETEAKLVEACQEAGLEVVRIPSPGDTDYMNWLVGNGFVAGMAFGDADADAAAQAQLETLFPGRDVHMIDANTLWSAGGGVHCVTNDQPALP